MNAGALLGLLAALLLAQHNRRGAALLGLLITLALALVLHATTTVVIEPAAAFLCVWLLIALPLLRCQLDTAMLRASLYQGLAALAVVLLSVDGTTQLMAIFPADPLAQASALLLPFSLLYFAGLVVCLFAAGPERAFPWDYPVWAAGWLLLMHPSLPALPPLLWGEGLGALTLTYPSAGLLYPARRRGHTVWVWALAALLAPLLSSLLLWLPE